MQHINEIYINGSFVQPHGTEVMELINPSDKTVIGAVRLADEEDARQAIAAAKAAYKTWSRSSKQERAGYLRAMHDAVQRRAPELVEVMIQEYGGTRRMCSATVARSAGSFLLAIELLESFDFVRQAGTARVTHGAARRGRHDHAMECEHRLHRSKLAMAIGPAAPRSSSRAN
jgi:aldehyde dehydrogenase (NAD+)